MAMASLRPAAGVRRLLFLLTLILVLPLCSANASPITFTFTGNGSGSVTGTTMTTFSNTSFSLTFASDTSSVVDQGGGYYRVNDISGSFAEGSYTATVTNATIVVNGDSGFENVNVYNSLFDDGVGLQNNSNLSGYMLMTPVSTGTATGGDLELTSNMVGDGFTTTSGTVIDFTGLTSLSFTAAVPAAATPEPSTWLLLATGVSGLAAVRRRIPV